MRKQKIYRPASSIGVQRNNDPQLQSGPSKWNDQEYHDRIDKVERLRQAEMLPMKSAEDLALSSKKWLFKNWIETGQLTLIAGLPNVGKTTLSCALAAAVSRRNTHTLYPGLSATGDGLIIFVCQEDDIQSSLKARLYAAGADMSKIRIISNEFGEHGESPFSINSQRDQLRLRGYSESINQNIGMIVLDPVYQAIEGDFNNDYKARMAYVQLTRLAKQLSCAIVGICHAIKSPRGKDPLARVAGPQALRQVPRSIILLSEIMGQPTENGGTHVMLHAKNIEGNMNDGYEYCLRSFCISENSTQSETTIFDITKDIIGRPYEIIELADAMPEKSNENKTDIAIRFLFDILKNGEILKNEIIERALAAGIKEGTLLLAKAKLEIVTRKGKGDGKSLWCLPKTDIG